MPMNRLQIVATVVAMLSLCISPSEQSAEHTSFLSSNFRRNRAIVRYSKELIVRGGSHKHHEGTSSIDSIPCNNTQLLSPSFELNIVEDNTFDSSCVSQESASQQSDIEYQRALTKTILTISLACLFGIGVMTTRGVSSGYEFFAGYLIEQSLSIDNLFVFLMLFDYFKVPIDLQNRVLSWGIGGAIVLRGLMIGVGVAALQKFRSVILVFAGILIASSVNLLSEGTIQDETHHSAAEENLIMKLTKMIFPNTSGELHGEDFFVKNNHGKMIATPLFLCLVCVELSDFVFAVDSIPAVLGVSKDPLIVYASNIFAIMALRSLYTVLAKAVSNFRYLKPAVALVLGFVGLKMVGEYYHYEISTGVSLVAICTLLGGGVVASILENRQQGSGWDAKKERNITM
jgi:TerC family integral membrane protein